MALDFEVQGPTPGREDQVDVLVAACRRETIDSRVEVLELAGLTPKVVDVEAYAMERAYELVRPLAGVDPAATVVLGGVFRNEETQQIQKVPVLGDLPGVGTLFRSTANTNKKVETLIFITPRILSEVLLD